MKQKKTSLEAVSQAILDQNWAQASAWAQMQDSNELKKLFDIADHDSLRLSILMSQEPEANQVVRMLVTLAMQEAIFRWAQREREEK